ncbi:hypothetical protein GGD65_007955 [Bradyrhizobium sp. CIR18]|nr:hypothetical protein [Bradyrhizobium sp. CIR18]NYG45616.1 hypothetical protein [Bradyrhizobium sp. IAR9]
MIQVLPQQNVHRRLNLAMSLKFRSIADQRRSHWVGQQMERHFRGVSLR